MINTQDFADFLRAKLDEKLKVKCDGDFITVSCGGKVVRIDMSQIKEALKWPEANCAVETTAKMVTLTFRNTALLHHFSNN